MYRSCKQSGAGLVAAIALIVIVAVVALAVTRTVRLGAGSVSLDILNQRALQTAASGAELGLNRVFAPAGAGACVDHNWDLSLLAGLPSCQATVTCDSEVVRGKVYYSIASRGTCNADTLQAERVVQVRATP